jgi:NAD(P)-dependent dehydrogenase (short-subunit alcohol dehydrogenase family)
MGDATAVNMDHWDRDMRINLTSMVLMARHTIPEMRKNGQGVIVNMSSVSGRKICPSQCQNICIGTKILMRTTNYFSHQVLGGNPNLLYPTTKGAIIQMTRAMAAHHGPENIRVNCVCPGMVFTPMVSGRGVTPELRQERIKQNMLKKEGNGWDVGYGMCPVPRVLDRQRLKSWRAAILFLCSKEARWITGLIMPVDGGVSRFSHMLLLPGRLLTWWTSRQLQAKLTDLLSRQICLLSR